MDPKSTKSEWKFGTRSYDAGEVVFQEGDLGIEAYIVQSGKIDILKSKGEGEGVALLGTVTEGALFGEMALVDDECRMASAVCREQAILRIVPVDVFESKFTNADPFIRALIKVLARNARADAATVQSD